MTYIFVVRHTLFSLSCIFKSIYILVIYVCNSNISLTFVRLYGNIISVCRLLLSGKKRQNHIFSTNIISYTCFTKKGLSFEAM